MAGIGFELRKLVKKGTYFSYLRAFLYGTVLSSGPWILTVLVLIFIALVTKAYIKLAGVGFFTITIIYTYAFSLILTGPVQIIFTRYVADKVFLKRDKDILPAFFTSSSFIAVLALSMSGLFYGLLKVYLDVGNLLLYKTSAVFLFVTVCLIWMLMSFVSTTKEYKKVFYAFLLGSLSCFLLAMLLVKPLSVSGAVTGFLLGQLLIMVILYRICAKGLERDHYIAKEFFVYFKKYPAVALTGLFYNIGLWIDKILMWCSHGEMRGASLFYSYNTYDVPSFLAFLTIIPALAYFLIITETNFYQRYKKFVSDILHETLITIETSKEEMYRTLKEGLYGMIKFQGVVTLIIFILTTHFLRFLGYRSVSPTLMRILLFGAFFHVIMLNINIILLYLELRKDALAMVTIFMLSNLLFTSLTIYLGPQYYGLGYLAATAVSLLYGWRALFSKVPKIDYLLYISQPI